MICAQLIDVLIFCHVMYFFSTFRISVDAIDDWSDPTRVKSRYSTGYLLLGFPKLTTVEDGSEM